MIPILALAACLPPVEATHDTADSATATSECDGRRSVATRVGSGAIGCNGPQGASNVWLYYPTSIAFTPDGALVFADYNNHAIRELEPSDLVATIAGTCVHEPAIEGPADQTPMENPIDAVVCDQGVVVAEQHASRVDLIADGMLTFLAGGSGEQGYDGDGGPALDAHLAQPTGVACGPGGEIFVSDTLNNVVRVVTPDGNIDTLAGTGVAGSGDGPGASATFNQPQHLVVHQGGLYVADLQSQAIRRIDLATREVTTVAGNGRVGFSGDGGPAVEATLRRPIGLDFAPDGTMYIADTGNSVIRAVGVDGVISTVMGLPPGPELDGAGLPAPHAGWSGDAGSPTTAALNNPYDVGVGSDCSLWIADSLNSVIRTSTIP
jgi:DNA-binding beta-propeller fold protein YncE